MCPPPSKRWGDMSPCPPPIDAHATGMALEEYTFQGKEVDNKLETAKKEARTKLVADFEGAELRTATQLFGYFTRPRQPSKGTKRKREQT